MRSFNFSSPIPSGFAAALISVALAFAPTHAVELDSDWAAVLEEARGQTVCSTSRCSCNWNLVFNCS